MACERLAIQRVGVERLVRHRLLAGQAAAKLLFDLELLLPELHFLFAMIGPEEDEFAGLRLHLGVREDGMERNAGPPPVSGQPLQRTAIARAFEAGDELGAAHLSKIVE